MIAITFAAGRNSLLCFASVAFEKVPFFNVIAHLEHSVAPARMRESGARHTRTKCLLQVAGDAVSIAPCVRFWKHAGWWAGSSFG